MSDGTPREHGRLGVVQHRPASRRRRTTVSRPVPPPIGPDLATGGFSRASNDDKGARNRSLAIGCPPIGDAPIAVVKIGQELVSTNPSTTVESLGALHDWPDVGEAGRRWRLAHRIDSSVAQADEWIGATELERHLLQVAARPARPTVSTSALEAAPKTAMDPRVGEMLIVRRLLVAAYTLVRHTREAGVA